MDQALIRGLEALKKGIELRETGTPRRSIKPKLHKMEHRTENHLLAPHAMRQFPPPWTIEALEGGFKVDDCCRSVVVK